HADAINDHSSNGASIYTLADKPSDPESEALASRENRADEMAGLGIDQEPPEVANILLDLAQRERSGLSGTFAELAVRQLSRETGMVSTRPHRQAGFAVLRASDMPAVLVELGFLSNSADERKLLSAAHRAAVATALTRAIDQFFARAVAGS